MAEETMALEKSETETSARKDSLDHRIRLLYAFGICMVVLAHCRGGGIVLLFDWFPYGGLHVALFMFCGGYLYKNSAKEIAGGYILGKLRRLILPLYVYNLAYGLIAQLLHRFGFQMGGAFTLHNLLVAPLIDGHQFVWNMAGWFVVPLFMAQVFTVLFRKSLHLFLKKTPEYFCAAACVVLGIIGNQLAIKGYKHGWMLAAVRLLHLLPFFGFGVFYRHVLEPVTKKIPSWTVFPAIIAAKLLIVLRLGRMPDYTSSWCSDFIYGPVMPIVTGALGIAFYMRAASILEPVAKRSRTVDLIAGSTYSIMMNHLLGILLVKSVFAGISRFTPLFPDFDWSAFHADIWWYYLPRGSSYTLILYVLGGILFSILIQKMLTRVSSAVRARRA